MASKGIHVKALDSRPKLSTVELFYNDLFVLSGGSTATLLQLNQQLYHMGQNELYDAIMAIMAIKNELTEEDADDNQPIA